MSVDKKSAKTYKFRICIGFFIIALCGLYTVYLFKVSGTLSYIQYMGTEIASVILSHNPKLIADIQSKYHAVPKQDQKVSILLVPGHEPNFGGTEFRDIKERDITLELAHALQLLLQGNPRYQTIVTRDTGSWNTNFATYFKNNWDDIALWRDASKEETIRLMSISSSTIVKPAVSHNSAPNDVSVRLYGITKWANENDIDIVIHIHFNDETVHKAETPGEYSGFAIYVPSSHYGNSPTSKAIGNSILHRMQKFDPISNLKGETTGLVDEPELIAIGANNTADAASILIEYGYIYEPQLLNPNTRGIAIKDLAFQTYLGLQDFFNDTNSALLISPFETSVLPYTWSTLHLNQNVNANSVYALQTALIADGVYPPHGKTKNECPRTGIVGDCTRTALMIFQQKYRVTGENGVVGPKTLSILNEKY